MSGTGPTVGEADSYAGERLLEDSPTVLSIRAESEPSNEGDSPIDTPAADSSQVKSPGGDVSCEICGANATNGGALCDQCAKLIGSRDTPDD
jgi:hypothetical protein